REYGHIPPSSYYAVKRAVLDDVVRRAVVGCVASEKPGEQESREYATALVWRARPWITNDALEAAKWFEAIVEVFPASVGANIGRAIAARALGAHDTATASIVAAFVQAPMNEAVLAAVSEWAGAESATAHEDATIGRIRAAAQLAG